MFANMVPAHIARRVGWNNGFDHFDPAVDISAGPMIIQSVSTPGTAVLVRNPKWWGTPAIVNRITVNVASNQAAWMGAVAAAPAAAWSKWAHFGLQSLDAVSSLPEYPERGQAVTRHAAARFQRHLTGGHAPGRPPGHSARHRSVGVAGSSVRFDRPRAGGQPGPPGGGIAIELPAVVGRRRVRHPRSGHDEPTAQEHRFPSERRRRLCRCQRETAHGAHGRGNGRPVDQFGCRPGQRPASRPPALPW